MTKQEQIARDEMYVEVFKLVEAGKSISEIAVAIGKKESVVKTHIATWVRAGGYLIDRMARRKLWKKELEQQWHYGLPKDVVKILERCGFESKEDCLLLADDDSLKYLKGRVVNPKLPGEISEALMLTQKEWHVRVNELNHMKLLEECNLQGLIKIKTVNEVRRWLGLHAVGKPFYKPNQAEINRWIKILEREGYKVVKE